MRRHLQQVLFAAAILAAVALSMPGSSEAQGTAQFEPPTVISTTQAAYPINSVASGTVILEVQLDERGSIDSVKVLHGIASLTDPAVNAVKKWKFSAAKLNGRGIPSSIPVAFTFVPPNVGPRI